MCYKKVTMCLLLALVLCCGCGKEKSDEEVVVVQDLRPISTEVTWDNISIKQITPVTAFETDASTTKIFPFNNSDKYITIEKIVISDNGFWETLSTGYKDTNNFKTADSWSLITTTDSISIGYLQLDEENAYIVKTNSLPSSYCILVLEQLCQTLNL